jgi:hypothetical protein
MTNRHTRLHVLSTYALDVSKPQEEKKQAYAALANIASDITEDDDICIQGDFNASVTAPNTNAE